MRIIVVGAGPAGLYFSLLAKKQFPSASIQVYEQNSCGATYGFGIVLADRVLSRFRDAHGTFHDALTAASLVSRNRIISHPDESLFVEGGGYGCAIGRLQLLEVLHEFCTKEGVSVHYETRVVDTDAFAEADLIVGADGVNSAVRSTHKPGFGTKSYRLTNRLAWYGTTRHFPYPLLSFKRNEFGHFLTAAYAYNEQMGTFVSECDEATFFRAGMDRMSEEEQRLLTESIFADELQGQSLIGNQSAYRPLSVVRNDEWYVHNCVLIGDALHSAHPSIGSGTRIAMEDSIALTDALARHHGDVRAALVTFRRLREPAKHKLLVAGEKSFQWYETFAEKVESLRPVDFTFDFLTRTGRVTRQRLLAEYPLFVDRYLHRCSEPEAFDATLAPAPHVLDEPK
jgi:2-polyprenyl-6-methoxyphenol hydroxylase-like FAD-dependent oxidoreductase